MKVDIKAAEGADAATMEAGMRLLDDKLDDLALLGWPFVNDKRWAPLAGLGPHLTNSIAVAELYAATAAR